MFRLKNIAIPLVVVPVVASALVIGTAGASSPPSGFSLVNPTSNTFRAREAQSIGDLVIIRRDVFGGADLTVTDGTADGTIEIDINPGAGASNPHRFVEMGGKAYFVADDGTHGYELWVSDGTEAGTQMVKDIEPGATGSWPSYGPSPSYGSTYRGEGLYVIGNEIYFTADTTANGLEVWKTDGTAAGTTRVTDIVAGSGDGMTTGGPILGTSSGVIFNGKASSSGFSYYLYDGTNVTEFSGSLAGMPNALSANTSYVGYADGTKAIINAAVNNGSSDVAEIWITDGSTSSKLMNGTLFGWENGAAVAGDKIYFTPDYGGTLSVVDVATAQVAAVPTTGLSSIEMVGALGSTVIFLADDGSTGSELYAADGSAQGTVSLGDLHPGSSGQSRPNSIHIDEQAGVMYFPVRTGEVEVVGMVTSTLWVTDGTVAGTRELTRQIAAIGIVEPIDDTILVDASFNRLGTTDYSFEGLVIGRPGTASALDRLNVGFDVSGQPTSVPPSGMPPSLDPPFDPAVTEYSIEVPTAYAQFWDVMTVHAEIPNFPGAPVACTVNGEACEDDPGNDFPSSEPRFVEIVVTAADGSTTTYTITVSVGGVAPTTTTTTTTTVAAPSTTAAPVTTAPASGGSGSTIQAPTLVTSANQELLTAPSGMAKIVINGELVEVELVQAPEELRRSVAGARSFAQVRALQSLAQDMVAAVQAVLGEGVTLPISVTNTDTGATITGLVSDPVSSEPLAVPVEDVLLIVNESIALMVGGADGAGDPANIAFDGVLEFGEGGYVAVLAYGLTPGAAGEVVVMSSPRLLDTFTVGSDGGVAAQAEIPSDLEAGEHTVVVAIDGQSASLGFRVLPEGILPATGGESSPVPFAVLVLAAGGLAMLLVTRRRNMI